jgi:uncharacterized protein with HEPN domain
MPRDSDVYLEDVLTSIARIRDYTAGLDRETFAQDQRTIDAVARNLEIIGEAVKRLPSSVRSQDASVEWPKIAGLRDVLIHAYASVDLDIVWDIVTGKLTDLERSVRTLLRGR